MKEMVGGCCVCSDERGWPDNPLVYCDGNSCTVAVHQACYGIVTVPTGPWFCRKCESPETKGKVKCELCPSKSGALKRSDTGGWAHVVCALYIPEVRFGNVTSMEPIVLRLIPPERFNKTCYICHDMGKTHRATAGACMQCNKSGCKQQFHVTCAQTLGLLCEEAGNYLDNVKYCGYCQHHYSKLKKGGNVKTIPPYKPVSHDSQSSDSSCEKEGGASPMASGSGTPSHTGKSKGPGRKTSHTSTTVPGKNTPSCSKTPTNTPQPMDKKKQSPARRGSSTGDGGSSSKSSTPAPSPHHSSDTTQAQAGKAPPQPGGSSSAGPSSKVAPPAASPGASKPAEPVGVISSVASASATSVSSIATVPTSAAISTSVVQMLASKPTYQESVITNTEAVDTKQTKKRKAVTAAANNHNTPVDYATIPTPTGPMEGGSHAAGAWDGHVQNDTQMDTIDKHIKKAKTDVPENFAVAQHYASASPAPPPPPPPPAHSPASNPSPRHLPSPMPGPSGLHMRSPSQHQGGKAGREDLATTLLVSVPLPSTSHGLNLSTHSQVQGPSEMPGPSPHIFHQPQKQAAMEPSMPAHSSHSVPGRSWGGLNVAYEIQQDPNKPGVSGMGVGKEMGQPMGPTTITIRTTKKRAAMASAASSMSNMAANMQTVTTQSLAAVRRQPQPTPAPIYQETIKDSPPSSPSSERPLRSKMETKMSASCTAPHMLGNELNPESGVAASLQEQLTAELAAHAAGATGMDPMIPPPLINKAAPAAALSYLARQQFWAPYWTYGYGMMPPNIFDSAMRTRGYSPSDYDPYNVLSELQTNKIAPGASGGSGRGSSAQSLDQLLERQWEQGSQFLMEQAQHFDIASLLSCLHQLRTENVRLEEHVGSLLQRRDHLLAVNARLAIPLTTEIDQSKAYNASGVPCTITGPPEPSRPRENGGQQRPPQRAPETVTSERSHQAMMEQLIMREVQQKPS